MEKNTLILDNPCSKSRLETTVRHLARSMILWVAIMAGTGSAQAIGSVTLAWDPSPDPQVAGYCVYSGGVSRTYTNQIDVGNTTTATLTGLVEGRSYYFAVTAYSEQRIESVPSAELFYTVPAPVVALLKILRGAGINGLPRLRVFVPLGHAFQVQASEDLQSWTTVRTDVSRSTNWIEWVDPQATNLAERFYRLAVQ